MCKSAVVLLLLTGVLFIATDAFRIFGFGVDRSDITYYLFTKENPDGISVNRNQPSVISDDSEARTVFIIHGWFGDKNKDWFKDLKDAYLSRNDTVYQVVQVDWSTPAKQFYPISKDNAKQVGQYLGYFIAELSVRYLVPLSNFEITGHSLGAHIAGFAGQKIYDMSGRKVRRITGLDPAGPLYEGSDPSERLSSDDAEIVAVLHTDKSVLGYSSSIGTIDFYANGGKSQPGCLDLTDIDSSVSCNHQRSFKYLIESLKTNKIVATKCSSYGSYYYGECDDNDKVPLGADFKPEQTGDYYFRTNASPPYAFEEEENES